jgi:hypothetical protein
MLLGALIVLAITRSAVRRGPGSGESPSNDDLRSNAADVASAVKPRRPPNKPRTSKDHGDGLYAREDPLRAGARSEFIGIPWHVAELQPTRSERQWSDRVEQEYATFLARLAAAGTAAASGSTSVDSHADANIVTKAVAAATAFLAFVADNSRPLPSWRPVAAEPLQEAACSGLSAFHPRANALFAFPVGAPPSRTPMDLSNVYGSIDAAVAALNETKTATWLEHRSDDGAAASNSSTSFRGFMRSLSAHRLVPLRLLRDLRGSNVAQKRAQCQRIMSVDDTTLNSDSLSLLDGFGLLLAALQHGALPVVCEYIPAGLADVLRGQLVIRPPAEATTSAASEKRRWSSTRVPRSGALAGLPHEILHAVAVAAFGSSPTRYRASCGSPSSSSHEPLSPHVVSTTASAVTGKSVPPPVRPLVQNATLMARLAAKLKQHASQSLSARRRALFLLTALPVMKESFPTRVLVIHVSPPMAPAAAVDAHAEAHVVKRATIDVTALALERGFIDADAEVTSVYMDASTDPTAIIDAERAISLAATRREAGGAKQQDSQRRRREPVRHRGMPDDEAGAGEDGKDQDRQGSPTMDPTYANWRCAKYASALSMAWSDVVEMGAVYPAAQSACALSATGRREAVPKVGVIKKSAGKSGDAGDAMLLPDSDLEMSDQVVRDVESAIRERVYDLVVYHLPSLDLILGPPGSPQRSDGEKFARDFGHAAQFHDLHRHLPLWTAVHEHVDRDRTMFVVGDVFTLPRDVCAPLSGSTIPGASLLLGGRGLLRAGSPSSIHGGGGGTPFVETGEGRGALLAFLSHHGAVVLRDAIACDEAYHVQ